MVKIRNVVVVVLMALSTAALAGERAFVEPIGFSKDGKYFAYIESFQELDGSGGAWATVTFVDVAKNAFAAKSVTEGVGEPGDKVIPFMTYQLAAMAKARPTLNQLGIVPYSALEAVELSRESAEGVSEVNFSTSGFTNLRPNLKVIAQAKPVKPTDHDFGNPRLLKVLAASMGRGETSALATLQEDKRLPASRGRAYDYSVRKVYVSGFANLSEGIRFVAIIDVVNNGFEGPSISTIPVSGSLK